MDLERNDLMQLVNALPDSFDFYHLGTVKQESHASIGYTAEKTCSIVFHLQGDLEAWVMILFDHELDTSLYSELGNLIVSKIANYLSAKNGLEIMISPPQSLNHAQAKKIIQTNTQAIKRTYVHFYNNSFIPIETVLLPTPLKEKGYA